MYVQFLIEDVSGKKLIDAIMKKYMAEKPDDDIEYSAHSYKGIGGFTKGQDARILNLNNYSMICPRG